MIGSITKLLVTVAWLLVTSVPSWLLLVFDVRLYSSSGASADIVILPMLWLVCAALSSSIYCRILGHVDDVQPTPQAEPDLHHLHHLPRGCVGLVHEAAAIRANLDDPHDALLRAWRLTQEVEHAAPDARAFMDRYGATLDPLHQLLDSRRHVGRASLSDAQLCERLAAALSSFEDALRYPRANTFR